MKTINTIKAITSAIAALSISVSAMTSPVSAVNVFNNRTYVMSASLVNDDNFHNVIFDRDDNVWEYDIEKLGFLSYVYGRELLCTVDNNGTPNYIDDDFITNISIGDEIPETRTEYAQFYMPHHLITENGDYWWVIEDDICPQTVVKLTFSTGKTVDIYDDEIIKIEIV